MRSTKRGMSARVEPPPVEFLTYVRNVPCTYACFDTDGYAQDRPLKQVRRYDNLSGSELEKAVSVCMGGGNACDHSNDGRRLTPAPPKPPKAPLEPIGSFPEVRSVFAAPAPEPPDCRSSMDKFYSRVDEIDLNKSGVVDAMVAAACEFLTPVAAVPFDAETQTVLDTLDPVSTTDAAVASDDSVDQEEDEPQAAPASVVVAETPLRGVNVWTGVEVASEVPEPVAIEANEIEVASTPTATSVDEPSAEVASAPIATSLDEAKIEEAPEATDSRVETVASVTTLEPEAGESTQAPVDLEAVVMPVVDTAAPLFSEPVAENEVEVATQVPVDLEAAAEVVIEEPEPVETETIVSESSVDLEAAASSQVDTEASTAMSADEAPTPTADEVEQFMALKGPVRGMLLDLGRKLNGM